LGIDCFDGLNLPHSGIDALMNDKDTLDLALIKNGSKNLTIFAFNLCTIKKESL